MLEIEFKNLIKQKIGQLHSDFLENQHNLFIENLYLRAGNGLGLPSGADFAEHDRKQQSSLRNRTKLIWKTIFEGLEAFSPVYSPDLADELKALADELLPEAYCNPWPYPGELGRPPFLKADASRKAELESIRRSAMFSITTEIELYCEKLKRGNQLQDRTPTSIVINGVSHSALVINSANSAASNNRIETSAESTLAQTLAQIQQLIESLPTDMQDNAKLLFAPLHGELSLPPGDRDESIAKKALTRFANFINGTGPVADNIGKILGLLNSFFP